MKYLRFKLSGCKDIGIRKFEFVAKTQFLYLFRLFQILFLVVGLAMFTTVIPEAMMLLGNRRKFGGSYKNERGKTFIVVTFNNLLYHTSLTNPCGH